MDVLRRRYDASLTVEGVFVVPFVITVIISLMALCFRLHNSVKEHADLMHLTEYARSLRNSGLEEREELTAEYAERILSQGYMYAEAPLLEAGSVDYFGLRRETVKRMEAAAKEIR